MSINKILVIGSANAECDVAVICSRTGYDHSFQFPIAGKFWQ